MKSGAWRVWAGVVLAGFLGAGWAIVGWGSWRGAAGELPAEVRSRVEQLTQQMHSVQTTEEDRRAAAIALRNVVGALPAADRPKLFRHFRTVLLQRMRQDVAEYETLSGADRRRFLDQRIMAMEQHRTLMITLQAELGGVFPRLGRPGETSQTTGAASTRAAVDQGGSRPEVGSLEGGGASLGGPPRELKAAMIRNMLDETEPEERAAITVLLRDLQARRVELGLQAMPGPPL